MWKEKQSSNASLYWAAEKLYASKCDNIIKCFILKLIGQAISKSESWGVPCNVL
jgi:hypothetical protein